MYAAKNGSLKVVKLLMDLGADKDSPNKVCEKKRLSFERKKFRSIFSSIFRPILIFLKKTGEYPLPAAKKQGFDLIAKFLQDPNSVNVDEHPAVRFKQTRRKCCGEKMENISRLRMNSNVFFL